MACGISRAVDERQNGYRGDQQRYGSRRELDDRRRVVWSADNLGEGWMHCAPLSALLQACALGLCLGAGGALANPDGGRVVAGDITISTSGPRLDVVQKTDRGIVDWRGFSIDSGEQTRFSQPSAASVTLNRVAGGVLSHIDGQLTANGRVFLVNPNGVLVGPNAQISVGGLVATTSDIPNDRFLVGDYRFDRPSDNPDAAVVNQGEIQIADGGAVVLAAPRVSNEGSIQARLGRVELAGTETFTLDFDGDGLLSFELGEPVRQLPPSVDSETAALVSNTGGILADGGLVSLSAHTADAVIDRAINMEGVVQARAVQQRGGVIVLSGGEQGIVSVSGSLDASATGADQRGGVVKVLGEKVGLVAGAEVDVSGPAGGGEVLVGGNLQGKGPERNASVTYVGPDAHINADAVTEGDGGRVIVWADNTTRYRGDISARGGDQGGDGGFVEVSGKRQMEFLGGVTVDAIEGGDGVVLLDPTNIMIVSNVGLNDNLVSENDFYILQDEFGDTLEFSDQALNNVSGNIVLQARRNIEIRNDVKINLHERAESLVLQAGEEILVGEGSGGDSGVSISTNGADLTFEADSPSFSEDNPLASLRFDQGVKVSTDGGDLTLIAMFFDLVHAELSTGLGNIHIAPTRLYEDDRYLIRLDELGGLAGIRTDGVLTIGQATTTDSQILTATHVISESLVQSYAPVTVFLAEENISILLDAEINQDGSYVLQSGGDISINNPVRLGVGDLTIEADSDYFEVIGGDGIGNPSLRNIATDVGNVSIKGNVVEINDGIRTNAGSISINGSNVLTYLMGIETDYGTISLSGRSIVIDAPVSSNTGTIDIVGGDIQVNSAITSNNGVISLSGETVDVAHNIFVKPPQLGSIKNLGGGISITADNLFMGGSVDSDTGDIVIAADSLTSSGAIVGKGKLIIKPKTATIDIGLATLETSPDRLELDQLTLEHVLGDGFESITFGGEDGSGEIEVGGVTFRDPVVLRTPRGGNINILGPVSTADLMAFDTGGRGSVSATNPLNDFFKVTVNAGDVSLADANTIELETVVSTNNISMVADGDIIAHERVLIGRSGQFSAGGVISFSGAVNVNGASSFTAKGSITMTDQRNAFFGDVGLVSTGSGAIDIVTADLLTLTDSFLGSGRSSISAGDLNLAGPLEGTGRLVLQPFDLDQDIGLGEGAGSFSLSIADLAQLRDGFASIQIGADGMTGAVAIQNAIFNDPLVVKANGAGASILINERLSGLDDASFRLEGSGATTILNGDIVTNGGPIVINDSVLLTSDALLDTTAAGSVSGGDITLSGPLSGEYELSLRGGFTTNLQEAPLDVGALRVIPTGASGNGARVFGTVNDLGGRFAAQQVQVEGGLVDPDFRINGCVMGIPCEGQERPAIVDVPVAIDWQVLEQPEPIRVWFQRKTPADPRDSRYSNLGNEELWRRESIDPPPAANGN